MIETYKQYVKVNSLGDMMKFLGSEITDFDY
jgi:hypothetical protein